MAKSSKRARIFILDKDNTLVYNISKEATSYSVEESVDVDDVTVFENKNFKQYEEMRRDFSVSFDAVMKRFTKEELEDLFVNSEVTIFLEGEGNNKFGLIFSNLTQESNAISSSITEKTRYSSAYKMKEEDIFEAISLLKTRKLTLEELIENTTELSDFFRCDIANDEFIIDISELSVNVDTELTIRISLEDSLENEVGFEEFTIELEDAETTRIVKKVTELTAFDFENEDVKAKLKITNNFEDTATVSANLYIKREM